MFLPRITAPLSFGWILLGAATVSAQSPQAMRFPGPFDELGRSFFHEPFWSSDADIYWTLTADWPRQFERLGKYDHPVPWTGFPRRNAQAAETVRLPILDPPAVDPAMLEPGEPPITYGGLFQQQWAGIVSDHLEYYSLHNLTWLAVGFGAGALMANTGFDEHFLRDAYLENVVRISNDEFYEKIHEPKFLGDGRYTLPVFAVFALSGPLIDDLPLGREASQWGQRSLRTFLVGAPPMLAAQLLTGGSRPGENSAKARWKPLRDDNGVSGHSFMGAIPFMSAAKMTDNLWLKTGLYVASTLPALSRINDDHHYFSQAFLGWWMAYLAASAVDRAHHPSTGRRWMVYAHPSGLGLGLEYRR